MTIKYMCYLLIAIYMSPHVGFITAAFLSGVLTLVVIFVDEES